VSPSDQPLEIRITLSREEAVTFLEKLARDSGFRSDFENDPYQVLADNGMEVSPREAVPTTLTAPDPEALESAIQELGTEEFLVPWNAQMQWPFFPFIGLLAKPMGGPEST
jgi:hypothetical protein